MGNPKTINRFCWIQATVNVEDNKPSNENEILAIFVKRLFIRRKYKRQ